MAEILDCLIIGGGPAGLTAAIYLARFRLKATLVDGGASRCALIPMSHNHAGFPGGVSGKTLLARMRTQAASFGGTFIDGNIRVIQIEPDGLFSLESSAGKIKTRTVLLATGVVNNRPNIADAEHESAVNAGRLRYCPICDGYEVTDKRIGVIGTEDRGFNEAVFLRTYTRDVTLISPGPEHSLDAEQITTLDRLNVSIVGGERKSLALVPDGIIAPTCRGEMRFDAIYPALGSVIRSELAANVGAQITDEGCLIVDDHQRTSVAGLYAAGDVVRGLDQISHAMGEAGVAAVTIRNDIAKMIELAR